MKLDTDIVNYIVDVVRTAKQVGLDRVVIEPGMTRGADEKVTRVMIHPTDIAMPFGSVAINRIDVFLNRIDLAKSASGFHIEALTHGINPLTVVDKDNPKSMFATALQLKAKGVKLDYKCSNPLIVKSPRNAKDRLRYKLKMTPEAYTFMDKGKSAFGTDEFELIIEDSQVRMEMVDINNDRLSYEFGNEAHRLVDGDDAPISYQRRFVLEYIKPLFKTNPDMEFCVSDRVGYIQLLVNNFTINILPKV